MRRAIVGLLLVSACSMSKSLEDETDEPGLDAGNTTNPNPAVRCMSPGMGLCVDFEDAPLTVGQAPAFTDRFGASLSSTNVLQMDRSATEKAARFDAMSILRVGNSQQLDSARNVTIEMWINPSSMPATNATYGLFDVHLQYQMTMDRDGRVTCRLIDNDDFDATADAQVPVGAWTHVACSYDGAAMRVYINGDVAGCDSFGSQSISTLGLFGAAIGSTIFPIGTSPSYVNRFIGHLDNVHLYKDTTLTSAQICGIAKGAGASCASTCPTSGGGSGSGGGGWGDDRDD
jgi:hypothetical protein